MTRPLQIAILVMLAVLDDGDWAVLHITLEAQLQTEAIW